MYTFLLSSTGQVLMTFFFSNVSPLYQLFTCQRIHFFTNTLLFFFLSFLVSLFWFWALSNHFFPANTSSFVCSLMCTLLLFLICVDHDVLVPPQQQWRLNGHKCRTAVFLSTALIVLSFCLRWQSCYSDY